MPLSAAGLWKDSLHGILVATYKDILVDIKRAVTTA